MMSEVFFDNFPTAETSIEPPLYRSALSKKSHDKSLTHPSLPARTPRFTSQPAPRPCQRYTYTRLLLGTIAIIAHHQPRPEPSHLVTSSAHLPVAPVCAARAPSKRGGDPSAVSLC
ncbi:hypothetical protein LY78DRAFT_378484 [Colletotrichum sublineola]|nr:hypothetical protein LY78DRAFT_378484 [Colletotrichum sublineola]